MFTLRRLVEGIESKNLPAIRSITLNFVDFRNAFDPIRRGKHRGLLGS